ncbi:KTSC domain-containing protein [Undibacterium sp. LX15W]|uniref:KTSC domain-containing protein n=1 Tax=Undibacterium flavidum TaxID=2762297 RepID=A0ABR6Y923_9BURK|nr:KTSC domain-containing protein [Undibacterium flavidum]
MTQILCQHALNDGTAIDYAGVGQEVWRRLSTASSSAAWSFYRDNIEEEFHGTRGRASASPTSTANRSALDALFQTPSAHDDEA